MTAQLTYGETGRGAWPSSGRGGTINAAGDKPGRFYRAPKQGTSLLRIGVIGWRANKPGLNEVSIDDWATYRACIYLQGVFGTDPDGIWGDDTDAKVKAWQSVTLDPKTGKTLVPDGVFGPNSARVHFKPLVKKIAEEADSEHPELVQLLTGHIAYESGWDPAAVGVTTPQDLGLGQINGVWHPDLTVNDRLNPLVALPYVANFVDYNLKAMEYNVRDAVAAYNLGVGGARSWIRDGRPDTWMRDGKAPVEVKRYIDRVLEAGAV